MYIFPLQTEAIPGIGIAKDVQLKLVDWFHINNGTVAYTTLHQKKTRLHCYNSLPVTKLPFDAFQMTRFQPPPWSRDFPEKLTVPQLIKKFPAIFGTRMFITTLTSDCHLSLTSARSVHASVYHFLQIHFNIILISQSSYSNLSLFLKYPHQNPICTSHSSRRTKGSVRACGPHKHFLTIYVFPVVIC